MTGSADSRSLYPTELISLLLPTRKRPALASKFLQSVVDNASHPEAVEVILYADEDDHGSHDLDHPDIRVHRIIGPKKTMGSYNSECLRHAQGEIIILVNDDIVIQTPGWDERIRSIHNSFEDKIYLAYANDLFKRSKLPAFPVLSRRTCDLLIDPYPHAYRGTFIDMHLFDIFKRLQHAGVDRICYLPDVVFEHRHYRNGKAVFDETYAKRGRFDDDATFLSLSKMRQAAAQRLKQAIQGKEAPSYFDTPTLISPNNLLSGFVLYSKQILFDFGLPWRWKIWLWIWLYGRFLAGKGWLKPFIG